MAQRSARVLAFLAACVCASSLTATTIVMPTDDELIDKSPVIVRGTVLSSESRDDGRAIRTETRIRSERVIGGGGISDEIVILEEGGRIGNRRTVIFGTPEYVAGETVLVFLWPERNGTYRTMDLFAGKFVERFTSDGRRIWHRSDSAPGTRVLDSQYRDREQSAVYRAADRFEEYIASRARGDSPSFDYLLPSEKTTLRASLAPSFTLIDEPEIYRWFTFDEGGTTDWVSVGTQPGYRDGGQSELSLALEAWNGYESARIRYDLVGQSTSPPGGLTETNGLNEIMFSDPLDEIAGTWKGGSGVVGRGGFNEVAAATRLWTSGFDAGSEYPKKTWATWEITEANLVIQDGVSTGTGFPSYLLAELIAHELGHTLGIGHSGDPESIMRAQLVRQGPELSFDDKDVARWLYPSGPYPDRPVAPSNVRATNVTQRYATVVWDDNAEDEIHQTLYRAREDGRFERVARVEANVTSFKLTGSQGTAYQVYVNASNDGGTSDDSNIAEYEHPEVIEANFDIEPASGIAGVTTFEFTDRSTGSVSEWRWTFGDGWSSNTQHPSHEYDTPGTYMVQLVVASSSGQESRTTRSIEVLPPPIPSVASFTYSPADPFEGEAVLFTDTSQGYPTSWHWDFGDGQASNERSPSHSFAVQGEFSVTLFVTDGSVSSSYSTRIVVRRAPSAFRELLPVVASVTGLGETAWRSELTLFNPGPADASVVATLLPNQGASSTSRMFEVASGHSVTIDDVIRWISGLVDGSGALLIEARHSRYDVSLRLTSRLYTTGETGTYGQSVASLPSEADAGVAFLTRILQSPDYRTNIGFANPELEDARLRMTLYDTTGDILGVVETSVPGRGFRQLPCSTLFPGIGNSSSRVFSIRIEALSGRAKTYASVIDNRSQDPVFLLAAGLPSEGPLWIPAVGRTIGTANTFWRSDLAIFNPASTPLPMTLRFHAGNPSDASAKQRWIEVGPHETLAVEDVLTWLGESNGSGALEIEWEPGLDGPIVSTRTYTMQDEDRGSYGQSIPPELVSRATSSISLTGIRAGSEFRTNVGLVNRGSSPVNSILTLLDPNGSVVAARVLDIPAQTQLQMPLEGLFSSIEVGRDARFSLRVTASSDSIILYASMIDNRSGDPVYVVGR